MGTQYFGSRRHGVICHGSELEHWLGLVEHWATLHDRCARMSAKVTRDISKEPEAEDCAYWYNEMGNMSVLSAAAYVNGWVALTETSALKRNRNRVGRLDGYFLSFTHGECVEAKYGSVNDWDKKSIDSSVHKKLEESIKDCLLHDVDQPRIAVVFLTISVNRKTYDPKNWDYGDLIKKVERSASEFVKNNKKIKKRRNNIDIVAWCCPDSCKNLSGETHYHPGVLLLAHNIGPSH